MAVTEGTVYPAKAFSLRGVALDVSVKTEGTAAVTRTAIVLIENVTFLERGGARKVSSASVTFLENVAVGLAHTVTLPDEETPRKVIRVTSRYGLTVQADGRLTEALLA